MNNRFNSSHRLTEAEKMPSAKQQAKLLAIVAHASYPYHAEFSKNHLWLRRSNGRLYVNKVAKEAAEEFAMLLRASAEDIVIPPASKIWLDIRVGMPSLKSREEPKGDAINILDWVADIVGEAMGVNDKWFAVTLDWYLSDDPMIEVSVGYEYEE